MPIAKCASTELAEVRMPNEEIADCRLKNWGLKRKT